MATKTAMRLEWLQDGLGFDRAYIIRGGIIKVKCSQCEAATINGIAAHETGCPNATKECKGCNARVPARDHTTGYCDNCR
jgi:hypothetical protein